MGEDSAEKKLCISQLLLLHNKPSQEVHLLSDRYHSQLGQLCLRLQACKDYKA